MREFPSSAGEGSGAPAVAELIMFSWVGVGRVGAVAEFALLRHCCFAP